MREVVFRVREHDVPRMRRLVSPRILCPRPQRQHQLRGTQGCEGRDQGDWNGNRPESPTATVVAAERTALNRDSGARMSSVAS